MGAQEVGAKLSFKRSVAAIKNKQAVRNKMRKPSGFQFAQGDSISQMSAPHWDAATSGASFFLQRDYLRMLEKSGPENIESKYALIFQDDVPVAAVYMQIVTVSGKSVGSVSHDADESEGHFGLVRTMLSPMEDKLRDKAKQRFLVCGNMLTYGFHGAAFAPGVQPSELWQAVAEAVYRVRRSLKLSGQADFQMIKDVTANEEAGVEALRNLSYRPLETEPNMLLTLAPEWKNYDGYLASLASKYRSSVRQQILKPVEAAGCTVERITGLAAYEDRLHELYLQVHENASIRPFTLRKGYFAALETTAGRNLTCTLMRKEGGILGFIISLKDGELGFGYHIGFDKAASADLPVYLRLLHASVEDALALGCKQLSLGRTALEPKARLGALPQPVTLWMRHTRPLTNVFVRKMFGLIRHDEAPDRNPFKTPAKAETEA